MKLKQAREAMGLTESDLAESTHMMAQMIREIEAEDYHRFSAPIYGKGFIKLFAKAVGLDPAPLVAEFMAAMAGAPDKTSKPPHVALEAIDKHNETGISIVTPEVPETPAEPPSDSPAPPAPVPRHVYAKASAVTMPNTDSPHPLPEPARPAPKPVPAPLQTPAPVQALASATPRAVEPTATESAPVAPAAPATPPPGDGFRLEAEPAVSVAPPRPVAAPVRPFQYPMPKQTSRPAPAPAPAREEEEAEDEDSFVERPARRRPPRRNRQRPSLGVAEALRNWADKAHEYVAALREKPEADDDDGGPLGDEVPSRRRWWIGGVAAAVVVLVFLVLSNEGGDESNGVSVPDGPEVVEGGVEPIADNADVVSQTPVESSPAPAISTTPAEIVRVLPPPKCFAR
jgi:transcriptional regulator with XRE-family HTH domain